MEVCVAISFCVHESTFLAQNFVLALVHNVHEQTVVAWLGLLDLRMIRDARRCQTCRGGNSFSGDSDSSRLRRINIQTSVYRRSVLDNT